jgi:hypothetical protein
LCNRIFCFKRPQIYTGSRWCIQCSGKVAQNVLLKWEKKSNRKHVYLPRGNCLPFTDSASKFHYPQQFI